MLKITKSEADGHTGHISIHAQVVEVDGNSTTLGALEVHGIHPANLQEQYNGDVREWIKGVHRGMVARHNDRKVSADAIRCLQGITIIEDEETNGHQT